MPVMPVGVPWTQGNVALPLDFANGTRTYFAEVVTATGITQDAVGVAVPSATVHVFQTSTDLEIAQVTSDGSGVYTAYVDRGYGQVYVKAEKAGSPNIQGVTDNFQPT